MRTVGAAFSAFVAGCVHDGGEDEREVDPTIEIVREGDCDASAEDAEYVDSEWWRTPRHDTANTAHVPVEGVRSEPSERWSYDEGEEFTGPAVVEDAVYFGRRSDGSVVAVDRESGDELWTREVGGWVSAPSVTEDGVYVSAFAGEEPGSGGTLVKLDRSGEMLWSHETPTGSYVPPKPGFGRVYYAGGGEDDEVLYSVDAETGEMLWNLTGEGLVSYVPAVGEGRVYVLGNGSSGRLSAVDVEEGTVDWRTEDARSSPIGRNSPTLHDGVVYFDVWGVCSTDGGTVLNVDVTGEAAGGGLGATAVSDDGMFVASASGSGYDLETAFRYDFESDSGLRYEVEEVFDVVATDSVLYVVRASEQMELVAFDLDGDRLWSMEAPYSPREHSLAVARDQVVTAGLESVALYR